MSEQSEYLKGPHRTTKDGEFVWINRRAFERIRNEGLGVNGIAVYMALAELEFISPKDSKKAFFFSRSRIAQLSGLSVRTVATVLAVLKEIRVIDYVSGGNRKSTTGREANVYRLLAFYDPKKEGGYRQEVHLLEAGDAHSTCKKNDENLHTIKDSFSPQRENEKEGEYKNKQKSPHGTGPSSPEGEGAEPRRKEGEELSFAERAAIRAKQLAEVMGRSSA